MTTEWVLVPREPTAKMVLAAFDAITNASGEGMIRARWRCMLDAAPAAPQMTDAEMIRTEAWQSITDELAHAAYLRGIEEGKRQAAAPQQEEPVAWMKPTRDSCYLRSAETMLAIHEDCDGIVRTGWKPLYLHPPANEVQRLREALAAVLDKLAKEQHA